ncbi:hypothetical protein JRQ81_008652 [Phrynocephalus forsythii]|uniref:Uncharacterized protein n=1 Tax=Phrynocephalus forsythii TaxID=171643 RepID=A0A9Q0XAL2_9SAUR|nr:hypothetical protein JRQ81_008652 [Phrynocephalus forsythii]
MVNLVVQASSSALLRAATLQGGRVERPESEHKVVDRRPARGWILLGLLPAQQKKDKSHPKEGSTQEPVRDGP